jgi:cation diffusion facilitator CzcD-associated flavoprotein CzcO
MNSADIAIIGAGPYGLSLAAHLRPRGFDVRIFGDPMAMWRTRMPRGMRLKSDGFASNLYDPGAEFPLSRFCAESGIEYADVGRPVALDTFARYGMAFQNRFVPDVENRMVVDLRARAGAFELRFADGGLVRARRVVVAVGIGDFTFMPPVLSDLPSELVTHSSHHHALNGFAGREVAVIGGGASAIDIAALLHVAGAHATLVARTPRLAFQDPPGRPDRSRPLTQRLRWPRSGIGNGWKSTICARLPQTFHRLPESMRLRIVRQHLGPAPCWFSREEVIGKVSMRLGKAIEHARPENERVRLRLRGADGLMEELMVDHVIAGTGFRTDLRRLTFIPDDLGKTISLTGQVPALSQHFESSVNGLYFVGPISASSFGPLTRFAFGAGFAAKQVSRHICGL